MIPVMQTKLHDPPRVKGNCFAAALASLLECDIEIFPPFEDWMDEGNVRLMPEYSKTLFSLGYNYAGQFYYDRLDDLEYEGVNGHLLVTGQSPDFPDANHCVIYDMQGNLAHDPHPRNKGVVKLFSFDWIEPTQLYKK